MDAVCNLSVNQLKAALVAKGIAFSRYASKALLVELYQQECSKLEQPGAAIAPERTWLDTRSANSRRGSVSQAPQPTVKIGSTASKKQTVLSRSNASDSRQPPKMPDFSLGSYWFWRLAKSQLPRKNQSASQLGAPDSSTNGGM